MSGLSVVAPSVPRIESLAVKNYRALRDLELKDMARLTVLLGPNGSGKSTIFDVFAFLSECFTDGLRRALDRRGRLRELRSRNSSGPVVIRIKYREPNAGKLLSYLLAIDEDARGPLVTEERLSWSRFSGGGRPFDFLNFKRGTGSVFSPRVDYATLFSQEEPERLGRRDDERLEAPDTLAVNALGQLARLPQVGALRRFITDWYLSYLSADNARTPAEAGPQERLSIRGDNLSNVIQYLQERHPERLRKILTTLSQRVPRLEKVDSQIMQDGRLLLQIKDAPFDQPILARFASDGTLKMLAYLVVLYDPEPPQLIGIEEPENFLHPRLLPGLAEECRKAAAHSQLMVTTHSPHFVNGLRSHELWVLYRDERGYTQARRVKDMPGVQELVANGAQLGHLWMEGYFEVGDPLTASGGPRAAGVRQHVP